MLMKMAYWMFFGILKYYNNSIQNFLLFSCKIHCTFLLLIRIILLIFMKSLLLFLLIISLFLFQSLVLPTKSVASTNFHLNNFNTEQLHVQRRLQAINNSGVSGIVDLIQKPFDKGTR